MPAPPAASDPIVFIVDDNDGVRETLELLFESVDQAVRSFASGREFLGAYPMGQSGCLITDVRMPEMSGLELYDEMRRRSIDLPVIFITGFGEYSRNGSCEGRTTAQSNPSLPFQQIESNGCLVSRQKQF